MRSEEFYQALDRVKVGDFYKHGFTEKTPIRGLVHIGANDGYEIGFYQQLGIADIICFEPVSSIRERCLKNIIYSVNVYEFALGNICGNVMINVADGNGGASSVLDYVPDDQIIDKQAKRKFIDKQVVGMVRWADFDLVEKDRYNCAVIDVQGLELDVLRGMDDQIEKFDYLVVEVSSKPVYRGEASADEVVEYLRKWGFIAITPMPIHDDMLFVRGSGVGKPFESKPTQVARPNGSKLNCGSGQRPFDTSKGWINIDVNPRWKPDLVGDWNNLSLFGDNSIDLIVSHHSIEHVGCGEADGFIREACRVLKPDGSLLIFIPDLRALAMRWMTGEIDDFTYIVNLMGAYMGDESDRHKWHYTSDSLAKTLNNVGTWFKTKRFDWRQIEGADIARDWWILGMEAVK